MRSNVTTTFLALVGWSACAKASVYGSNTNRSQFLEQLALSPAEWSRLSKSLRSIDLGSISGPDPVERVLTACLVADEVFGSQFISQSASDYEELIEVNWSSACWFEPRCIIQPTTTHDVSRAMVIITYFGTKFTIRSGGHNPNPGFAGIGGEGVLIDMSRMTNISLSQDGSVASIGPGNRFGAVDEALNTLGKTVHAGRIDWVGVGGYFLGGGLTYFNSLYGIAADNVVNYEVVLANSSIVNANAQTNSDLWWGLKGSGTNFGVITRYDVKSTDNSSYWFEGLYYAPEQNEALLDAVIQYANAAEGDPNAAISFSLNPQIGFVQFIYAKPVVRPSPYSMFYQIPFQSRAINSTVGSMVDLNNAISAINPDTHKRRMIASSAHRFDRTILKDIYRLYLDFDSKVQNISATTGIVVQPFTSAAVQHATFTGGNPVGFAEGLQNHMAYSIEWDDTENDEVAMSAIIELIDNVEALTKERGLFLTTKIVNDSGFNQNVLSSYPPENLRRLRDIAAQYDPAQVFQTLQNNGFLLSKS
ncbi:hypothetical protein F5Y10DRAFT_292692 [Nemania abortiva]|nr:hypothetical protein F5Y10DRAFT_292692 [Nemania abortiva]